MKMLWQKKKHALTILFGVSKNPQGSKKVGNNKIHLFEAWKYSYGSIYLSPFAQT